MTSSVLNGTKGHWLAVALSAALLIATGARAQERFADPKEAAQALVTAAKTNDFSRILAILGPAGRDIVESGDKVADKNALDKFLTAYDVKSRISNESDDKAVLIIGPEDWPFPIPLVRKNGDWRFDAVAGRQEILFRRIGRNERNAIEVCLAYVDAQKEFAQLAPSTLGASVYAERIASQPGKKDGLYWPQKDGEPASPLGELAAAAAHEGYRPGGGGTAPYHGYYYRILLAQGPSAPGGAYDYVVKGKMIGGFALVAYPAEYRNSGVMSFIVNHDGTVYQKDLGPRTSKISRAMTTFNPDKTWRKIVP